MIIKPITSFILAGLLTTTFFAQQSIEPIEYSNITVREVYNKNWTIGAGLNIVDDSGSSSTGISDPSENWNFSRPFYLSTEFYLNNKFSFMSMLFFNQYTEGKNIDDTIYIIEGHEASYFAFDVNTKYYFRDLLKSYHFDPYIFLGVGYTNIGEYKGEPIDPGNLSFPDYVEVDEDGNMIVPSIGRLTLNAGLGLNYWFSDTWGLNLNLAAKLGIGNSEYDSGTPNGISNQFQYSLGALYMLK